jgi:RTX calcium-binding nonapeptide repeat (4 copies)
MRWFVAFTVAVAATILTASSVGGKHSFHYGATGSPSAAPAEVSDRSASGGWRQTGFSRMPIVYYQGITSDPSGNFYFDGIFSGLYRTDRRLHETARNDEVIPPDVRATYGYNHIGDISWDAAEGGRLLLPLDCFHPQENEPNTCGTGAIGVADPKTLQWRYFVTLDPADIKKATWSEVSPDGHLVWTSSGSTLLAYRSSDIVPTKAKPGTTIKPVRRLAAAGPPGGITGAAFANGRLLVASSNRNGPGGFQVWSINPNDGSRLLAIERPIVGESEGLDVTTALGGSLHWQILPFNPQRRRPTYGAGHATLLHFVALGPCANAVAGTQARDVLRGGRYGEKIEGRGGDDLLLGNAGDDCLFGGPAEDTLTGGAGADVLVGDAGTDTLLAGPGDDTVVARDGGRDVVDCGPGTDTAKVDGTDDGKNCERIQR